MRNLSVSAEVYIVVQRSAVSRDVADALAVPGAAQEAEFNRLIAPLIEPAYRLALSMLDTQADAEDAVQDSAFRAWRKLRQLRRVSARAWFLSIVARRCLTMRASRWRSLLHLQSWLAPLQPADDTIVARSDLSRALRRLPPKLRIVLFLHYYMDLPLAEVSVVLGLSVGATKTRLHRALARLRPYFDVGARA